MATETTDPIDWTLDEVVDFLCNPERAPWASSLNTPRPDPATLGDSLRENLVTGEVLLHDVDSNTLKEDFGIKALGHRSSVLRAIKWLQDRSEKYKTSQQSHSLGDQSVIQSPPLSSYQIPVPAAGKTTQSESPGTKTKRRIAPTLMQPKDLQASSHLGFNSSPTRPTLDSHFPDPPFGIHRQSPRQGTVSRPDPDELFYSRLIVKYPPQVDEEALPCYGDSGSEGEFDQETWKEIEENGPTRPTRRLPPVEYESTMAGCISEQEARWNREKLPTKLHLAPLIWHESRSEEDPKRGKDKCSAELARFTSRLGTLKRGIMEIEHTSHNSLKRACFNLEQTVFQICYEKWKLSVLDLETCPPLVPRIRSAPRQKNRSQEGEDGEEDEESLISESPDSEDSKSDDDSVDIIISDTEAASQMEEILTGPSKSFPFTLGSSPHSDVSEFSQPVAKRRRLSQGDETHNRGGGESNFFEGIDSIDLTSPVNTPGGFETPEITHEPNEPENLEIETPPLNPIRLNDTDAIDVDVNPLDFALSEGSDPMQPETSPELGNDTEMQVERDASVAGKNTNGDEEMLVKTPPLNPQPSVRPALPHPRAPNSKSPPSHMPNSKPKSPAGTRQRSLSVSRTSDHTPNSGSDVDSEYKELFEKVSGLSMKEIETSKDRLSLLAKTVMCLRQRERRDYPAYLKRWMDCSYQDTVHGAIISMMQNKRDLGNGEKDGGQLGMRLGALFVSWFHCISLTPVGMPRDQLRSALESIDAKPLLFQTFMDKLRALIHVYNKLNKLDVVASHSDSEDTTQLLEPPGDRKSRKKRLIHAPSVSALQHRAKERQDKQVKIIETFRKEREKQGLSNDDPAGQAVAFKDPIICLPPSIGKFVKPHQLKGIQFMWRELCEAEKPQGCLLAHVMGLGKTMQVISFLVTVSEAASSEDPRIHDQVPRKFHRSQTLVLCPSSLVQNWVDEFAIWAPENHHLGSIREISSTPKPHQSQHRLFDIRSWNEDGGVLIMSYDMFRILTTRKGRFDEEEEKEIEEALLKKPNIVVADEAHKLRNEKSAISQMASRFQTQSRIAMTGSPLANNLIEYYQMLDWVAPGYLGRIEEFKEKFLVPIQAGSYIDSTDAQRRYGLVALKVLNGILNPKIHRADSSVVAQDLPPKTEFFLWVSLTELQKKAYNIFVEEATQGLEIRLWQWLAIMQLCCNHPHPFLEKLADRTTTLEDAEPAPSLLVRVMKDANLPPTILSRVEDLFKTVPDLKDACWSHRALLLLQILDDSKRVGDKVLIFSQSIPTMNYLHHLLAATQRRFVRIDGNIPPAQRQGLIKAFNTGTDIDMLLISTRAGGLGLNMFGANRVVIFDFLFNPTWEDQAVGRAYRLGQTKPVFVYRFVASGTFEDSIFNMTVFKSQLAARVVDKKSVLSESTRKAQQYLFPVRDVEKEDCHSILGKDPEVLDRIITRGFQGILKVTLSRIRDDDNDQLTETERVDVDRQVERERLKRTDPHAWERWCQAKRDAEKLHQRSACRPQQPTERPTAYQPHQSNQRLSPVQGPVITSAFETPVAGARRMIYAERTPQMGHIGTLDQTTSFPNPPAAFLGGTANRFEPSSAPVSRPPAEMQPRGLALQLQSQIPLRGHPGALSTPSVPLIPSRPQSALHSRPFPNSIMLSNPHNSMHGRPFPSSIMPFNPQDAMHSRPFPNSSIPFNPQTAIPGGPLPNAVTEADSHSAPISLPSAFITCADLALDYDPQWRDLLPQDLTLSDFSFDDPARTREIIDITGSPSPVESDHGNSIGQQQEPNPNDTDPAAPSPNPAGS